MRTSRKLSRICRLEFGSSFADGINLTGITDQVTATNSNVLSYTPVNRLATATGPWGTESFTYDATGNRLNDNVTLGASTPTRLAAYPTTSNRITSAVGEISN